MKYMKLTTGIQAIFIFACTVILMNACAPQPTTGVAGIFEGTSNVGGVKLIGNMVYDASTETYTLSGGGMNVWDNFDQLFYAWKKVKGDFSMTAKVAFEGAGVNDHRKTGIMIRETLDGESRCAHISIHGDGLTSLQYRMETDGMTEETVAPPNANYITLEKVGNKIRVKTAASVLPQDVTAEIEMDFPGTCYVGLYVCSHDVDVLETVYFTQVEFKKL